MKYTKIASGLAAIALLFTVVACTGNAEQDMEAMEGSASGDVAQASMQMQDQSMQSMEKLNLNTTAEDDFKSIPDVGDRMAYEFVEYRPYVSIQQFRQEIGKYVDEEQVTAFEDYVFVPIDPNESDAATLAQIPGLETEEADELISSRPFNSREAFLNALGDYVSQEEVNTAVSYLTSG